MVKEARLELEEEETDEMDALTGVVDALRDEVRSGASGKKTSTSSARSAELAAHVASVSEKWGDGK